MSIYEFDEEREMELIRQDERAEGEQIGLERGRAEGERAVLSLCRKFGCSPEESLQRLMEECGLTQEEAKERMEKYQDKEFETSKV